MVELDLGTASPFFPVTVGGAGVWTASLAVRPDPNLAGLQVARQIALFNTSGPLGFDLSNGLIVTIGY